MSIASFLRRRRRALLVGAATVLLHWTVLGWLGGEPVPRGAVAGHGAPAAVLLAQPVEAPPPAPPPPAPVELAPPPLPPLPPLPMDEVQLSLAQAPAASAAAALVAPPQQGSADGEAPVGAAPAAPSLPPPAAPASVPAASAPAAAAPELRRYKVNLPPPAEITLDVVRIDADGTRWSGEAALAWNIDDGGYRVKAEAGIRMVFARVNLVVLTSEGAVDGDGFAPVKMTEKRRGRALTATHFRRADGTITFSASQASYPLLPGSQDKATVPLQLAAIARGDPGQLDGPIDILVGADKDASVFRFVLLGQETIETRLGQLQAWHMSRPPKPGSYNSRLDVWLAPGLGWYPVQIRNTESSGAVTTQTVNNVVIKEAGT